MVGLLFSMVSLESGAEISGDLNMFNQIFSILVIDKFHKSRSVEARHEAI